MPDPRPFHVLVVDDLLEMVHLLEAVLRLDGYRVSTATDVQPLSVVRDLAPDLIIHDLLFGRSPQPSMTFLRELREDPVLERIPVVLCTVAAQAVTESVMVQELAHLDVRVVLKPFACSMLRQELAETLDTAHLSVGCPSARTQVRSEFHASEL